MAKKKRATVTIYLEDGSLFVRSEGDVVTVSPSIVTDPRDLDHWWQFTVDVDGKGRPSVLFGESHAGGVRDPEMRPW